MIINHNDADFHCEYSTSLLLDFEQVMIKAR